MSVIRMTEATTEGTGDFISPRTRVFLQKVIDSQIFKDLLASCGT